MWRHSPHNTPFADLTQLADVVIDVDYASSEEESGDEDAQLRNQSGAERLHDQAQMQRTFLSPLQCARFAHLLARLPSVNTKLRSGDVARVTNFAINHAGSGIDQIVDMLLLNIEKPFCTTLAAKYEQQEDEADDSDAVDVEKLEEHKGEDAREDPSNAKLVGLYIISDVLSASTIAGARNAWKYRQLLETGFREQKTFEKLGKLDKELGWGKMKAEQWKRKLAALFDIWEQWSAFSADVLQEFKRAFYMEPEEIAKLNESSTKEISEQVQDLKPKWMSRFKKIDSSTPSRAAEKDTKPAQEEKERDAMSELISAEIVPDVREYNTTGSSSSISNGRLTAPTRAETSISTDAAATKSPARDGHASAAKEGSTATPAKSGPKKRMKAEDMFADSDIEE